MIQYLPLHVKHFIKERSCKSTALETAGHLTLKTLHGNIKKFTTRDGSLYEGVINQLPVSIVVYNQLPYPIGLGLVNRAGLGIYLAYHSDGIINFSYILKGVYERWPIKPLYNAAQGKIIANQCDILSVMDKSNHRSIKELCEYITSI